MANSGNESVRRWFEEVWNKRRREAIAEMLTPETILNDGPTVGRGPEAFYPFFDRITASFSNMHITVEDIFGENDRVCARWSCTGTHDGDGLGFPPTGKTVSITGITIARLSGGKFAEAWQNWDMLGMMQQLQGTQAAAATYIGS